MRPAGALVLALALAVPRPAGARPFRVNEIPNGAAKSCQTCHETIGGVIFNPFGSDVRAALVGDGPISERNVDWSQLAARDSDGDGSTNGEELGDPDGAWRAGDPDPGATPSHPGDPASVPTTGTCGDGQLAASETCGGELLRGESCESRNLGGGTLACGADCRLDTTGCTAEPAPDDDDGEADVSPADEASCTVGVARTPGDRRPSGPVAGGVLLALGGLIVARRRERRPAAPGARTPP